MLTLAMCETPSGGLAISASGKTFPGGGRESRQSSLFIMFQRYPVILNPEG